MADSAATRAGAQDVIKLWSSPPPRGIEGVPAEQTFETPPGPAGGGSTMYRNVSEPTLTVFKPDAAKANGVGVIVCPGGGWTILAWQHEGIDVCDWLAARGYTAFLLKYRVSASPPDPMEFLQRMAAMGAMLAAPLTAKQAPKSMKELVSDPALFHAREIAADDGRRALALVRERAKDWSLKTDKIGMIGFSAGAFLVADVAMDPAGAPLAFVAPIYGGETRGSPVPADAPPLFTVAAQDDRQLYHCVEGLYADWSMADRPAEMHMFTRGGHGFGMTKQGAPTDLWIDLFANWLADRGFA